jgi:hypothetical protein
MRQRGNSQARPRQAEKLMHRQSGPYRTDCHAHCRNRDRDHFFHGKISNVPGGGR